jgi:hypothetical protein
VLEIPSLPGCDEATAFLEHPERLFGSLEVDEEQLLNGSNP